MKRPQDPGVRVEIGPIMGCEIGRVHTDVKESVTIAELLIPRPQGGLVPVRR